MMMKRGVAVFFLHVGVDLVSAGFSQMRTDLSTLIQDYSGERDAEYNNNDADLFSNYDFYEERTLHDTKSFALLLSRINGYGCWCYLDNEYHRGAGPPQDAVDEQCKQLVLGYKCVDSDAEGTAEGSIDVTDPTSGGACDIKTVTYNTGIGGTSQSMSAACESRNAGNECAIAACKIENDFVRRILKDLLTGNVDTGLKHNNGFNRDAMCVGKGTEVKGRACCGAYPNRFYFATEEGVRACCVDRTYDTTQGLQCCDDGKIEAGCD